MKTSLILNLVLLLNTSVLIGQILAYVVDPINVWLLVGIEFVLMAIYYIHLIIKDLREDFELNLGDLNPFKSADGSRK